MTTLRQAILLTADHIEQNPETYDFMSVRIPDCGTPGCLIGWVESFLGLSEQQRLLIVLLGHATFGDCMGVTAPVFYSRMNNIQPWWRRHWHFNAKSAATSLRKYADLYHPEEVETYPEISREIDRIFVASKAHQQPVTAG